MLLIIIKDIDEHYKQKNIQYLPELRIFNTKRVYNFWYKMKFFKTEFKCVVKICKI